jgi:hypothetical protein
MAGIQTGAYRRPTMEELMGAFVNANAAPAGVQTGGYSLPQVDIGLGKAPLAALFQSLLAGTAAPELAAPPKQGYAGPVPVINPMVGLDANGNPLAPSTPDPAGAAAAPFFTGQGLDKLFETWTNPAAVSQSPIPRSPSNTAAGNMAAGTANTLINAPQTLWHTYNELVGKPFAGAVKPMIEGTGKAIGDTYEWLTTPEDQYQANKAAKEAEASAEAPKGFKPGIPGQGQGSLTRKIVGVESGGNPTARNPKSSAYGPGQFIKPTWLQFIRETRPEVAKNLSEEDQLKLRADPALADEAVGWYAGKAVDILDSINAPATDRNIYLHHFLGPGGVKQILQADPTAPISSVLDEASIKANPSVLGGARTVQDVLDWAAVKMGETPSGNVGPAPIPRPMAPLPDFTAANDWFDKAAPTPVDPGMLKDTQLALMLEGIGAGLGSVDASREGGGRLFGALAAGSSQGNAKGQQLALDFANQLKEQQRDYALGRGELSIRQEGAKDAVRNANLETDWMNDVAQQEYEKSQSAALLQSAAAERARTTPKILETSDKGAVIQGPEGDISFLDFDVGKPFEELEQMTKAMGEDHNLVRQAKYATMAQTPGTSILSMEMEIVRDIINDGLGAAVWGDGFSEAMAAAEKQLPGTLAADPKAYQSALNKSLMGLLLGASQQTGNYDWVLQAAALGNPGAIMLTQGGTME